MNQKKCTCPPTSKGIDNLTLINLPSFHNVVRTCGIGNNIMLMTDKQMQDSISKSYIIQMGPEAFLKLKELLAILSNLRF